jgi:hypothetical protein
VSTFSRIPTIDLMKMLLLIEKERRFLFYQRKFSPSCAIKKTLSDPS